MIADKFSTGGYNRFLITIAGFGGLLYGIDIGIISAALLYLSKTINLSVEQTSFIVAAVLGGSMVSSLIAGLLADWLGRRRMMILSGFMFVASVVLIVISQSFTLLFVGRLLQGMSGGVIAVVIPLYLAETLGANTRGKGTGIFQLMLTIGIVIASVAGFFYTQQAETAIAAAHGNAALIRAAQDHAWRGMFLSMVYPGLFFFVGTFLLVETPRWLFRQGRKAEALANLRRLSPPAEAEKQLREMETIATEDTASQSTGGAGSLLQKKYVIPFLLACFVLASNQTTGINSVLSFLVVILKQAGMTASHATQGDVAVKLLNCIMTVIGVSLVDKKGRKFLLKLGTGGVVVSLLTGAFLFHTFESKRIDVRDKVQTAVANDAVTLPVTESTLGPALEGRPMALTVLYTYGDGDRVATAINTDADNTLKVTPLDKETGHPPHHQARLLRSRRRREDWLVHHRLPRPLHRLLRYRTRRRRLARSLRTHAHPHPLHGHGNRAPP